MFKVTVKWKMRSAACRWISAKITTKVKDPDLQIKNEMKVYLQSKPCLNLVRDFIPDRFLRVKKTPSSYTFVVDDNIAERIVHVIKDEVTRYPVVIEANPGLGLVTRYLLKAGARKISVFDSLFNPLPPLLQLISDNPERLSVVPSNFFDIHKLMAQDRMDDGNRFDTIFKEIKSQKREREPSLVVLGIINTPSYITNLIRSVLFRDPFTKLGRIQHFLILSDSLYKSFTCSPSHIRNHTLFNLCYDMEKIEEFPRVAFLPWDKGKEKIEISQRIMHLVKMTPKANIYDIYNEAQLKVLWHFLQSLGFSKKNNVIAYFETWIPNSGLKLIAEGLSPSMQVGDLTVPELLDLFDFFTSQPDFNAASYVDIHESGLLSEPSADENVESQKNPSKIDLST